MHLYAKLAHSITSIFRKRKLIKHKRDKNSRGEHTLIPFGEPAAALCKTEKAQLRKLIGIANSMSHGTNFVLLLNQQVDRQRLLPACINAMLRSNDRIATASKPGIEMLLLLCGKSDISEAISKCGASGNSFIVFATSSEMLRRFLASAKIEQSKKLKLKLDFDTAAKVAALDA
ncbi:MAG: hypothetical protein QXR85_02100 [Candidatus Micrarchaeaceae archaeon]